MTGRGRIDVHQHLVPSEYRAALDRHGYSAPGAWMVPAWDADGALAVMDDQGIATGVLSLSAPGTHFGDDTEARELTSRINEAHAELVKDRPDRFGMFAAVPLPDVDGALNAISAAYDQYNADGIVLLANSHGTYLGDEKFDPVLEELDRRHAVVFVHPTELPGPAVPGIHPALADFLLDTTRAAINLVLHGVPHRFPHVRFILSHAGGFMPYAAHRLANLASVTSTETAGTQDVLAGLSTFYFDTALSSSPTALPSLLAFVQPDHVLYGSDWPYATPDTVSYFTNLLDGYDGLDQAGHAAVNRSSAEALLPRLAG